MQALKDTLSPKTAYQYKTHYTKYVQWCVQSDYVPGRHAEMEAAVSADSSANETSLLYSEIPLSAVLFHKFALETLVMNSPGKHREDSEFQLLTLKKVFSSLNFLQKICVLHGNPASQIDQKYLESVIRLHTRWNHQTLVELQNSNSLNSVPALVKVSLNIWNPLTQQLPDKYFKTCLEKSRFLVDYHCTKFLQIPFQARSRIRLKNLSVSKSNDSLIIDLVNLDENTDDDQAFDDEERSLLRMKLLPQDCPFTCPLVSLATYLFLRFYGVSSAYKGDGFPNLLKDEATDLPLIRGKFHNDYMREDTLGVHYSAVFRYCSLPYKRREHFSMINSNNTTTSKYGWPVWDKKKYDEFFTDYKSKGVDSFPDDIAWDFQNINNYKSPYNRSKLNTNSPTVPKELLVQLFPELEQYKREHSSGLSSEAKSFITVMELLREVFIRNLPWIHKVYPNHDIFKDPLFQNPDFQSYFNDIVGNNDQSLPFNFLYGYKGTDKNSSDFTELYSFLVEPPLKIDKGNIIGTNNVAFDEKSEPPSDPMTQDLPSSIITNLKNQCFQFVQFQTLTNFQLLNDLLVKIHTKLEMKRSTREYVLNEINLLKQVIDNKISTASTKDILEFFSNSELPNSMAHQPLGSQSVKVEESLNKSNFSGNSTQGPNIFNLMSLDSEDDTPSGVEGSPDVEDEVEDDDMQEELKIMINQLVTSKISTLFEKKLDQFEIKLNHLIDNTVDKKVNAIVNDKMSSIFRELKRLDNKIDKNGSKRSRSSLQDSKIDDNACPNLPHNLVHTTVGDYKEDNNNGAQSPIAKKSKLDEPRDTKRFTEFVMDESISSIEHIVIEWFTPNPKYGGQSVHSLNQANNKAWRRNCEMLYRTRKTIIEFYIYLVNSKEWDRYEAVDYCEQLMVKTSTSPDFNQKVFDLSNFLKDWKKKHDNSFEGLVEYTSNKQVLY